VPVNKPVPKCLHSGFLELRMMAVVATIAAICIGRPKRQSNRHRQQINTQLFTGRMPFPLPNEHYQTLHGKVSHSTCLFIPSSSGASKLVCDQQRLLITMVKGCQASHQPSDASIPLYYRTCSDDFISFVSRFFFSSTE